jgi:hypothetical protein
MGTMNRIQFVTITGLLALIFVSVGGIAWDELKPTPIEAQKLQPIGPQILHALKAR